MFFRFEQKKSVISNIFFRLVQKDLKLLKRYFNLIWSILKKKASLNFYSMLSKYVFLESALVENEFKRHIKFLGCRCRCQT